jgi:hypothetical protein
MTDRPGFRNPDLIADLALQLLVGISSTQLILLGYLIAYIFIQGMKR